MEVRPRTWWHYAKVLLMQADSTEQEHSEFNTPDRLPSYFSGTDVLLKGQGFCLARNNQHTPAMTLVVYIYKIIQLLSRLDFDFYGLLVHIQNAYLMYSVYMYTCKPNNLSLKNHSNFEP